MCVVSFIGDHYSDKWNQPPYRQIIDIVKTIGIDDYGNEQIPAFPDLVKGVTRQEFDQLKKDVEEMKELLKKAKIYDEVNHEPDCELESKMTKLREIAKLVGIDLDDVIGKIK